MICVDCSQENPQWASVCSEAERPSESASKLPQSNPVGGGGGEGGRESTPLRAP
uniref:Uncharacterized protein n=1 Tax=Nelumbo nucifera TaxID=4432 RepID=A0A822Y7L2_NELNU|nr:TPA_asm: hypothetical protein HUJ06_028664 [Nelumbo nucifera]